MRKQTICMGENKDADQLRGNREADQRLCFRYTDSTFPPLLIPKFSRFWVSSVTVQAGLCWTWSETQIVGFVMHRLIIDNKSNECSTLIFLQILHYTDNDELSLIILLATFGKFSSLSWRWWCLCLSSTKKETVKIGI